MIGKKNAVLHWLIGQDDATEWEIKPFKKARTKRQNAYYWALITELADVLNISKIEAHNHMLRDYGQPYIIEGECVYAMFPDTDEAEAQLLRASNYHVAPTSQIRAGTEHDYRAYRLLRGSSDYNTAEMSVLLNGLIAEAQAQNIDTITPDELEKMRAYDEKHERSKE